jgi:hypothetical protein
LSNYFLRIVGIGCTKEVLRVLVIIFSLNSVACAGLFPGKPEIIIVALGTGQRGVGPRA